MKKRIEWLDAVRGFAIILVILGHSGISETNKIIYVWIYSFHMALFFTLSGYVFSVRKQKSYKEFVVKKIRTLLVPYMFYQVLQIFFGYIYSIILNGSNSQSIIDKFFGMLFQLRGSRYESSLWFLTCLFVMENIMYFLITISEKRIKLGMRANRSKIIITGGGVMAIVCVACAYNKYIRINLPWYIDLACICIVFMYIGYYCGNQSCVKNIPWRYILMLCLVHAAAGIINYNLSGHSVDVYWNYFGNYILFYAEGIAGSLAIIFLFQKLDISNFVLEYIGNNSLIFYVLHQNIVMPISGFILNNLVQVNTLNSYGTLLFFLGKTVITCGMIFPMAYFITKYLRFTIGK